MERLGKFKCLCLVILAGVLQHCVQTKEPEAEQSAYYTADDFDTVEKFDSHVHINTYDSTYLKQAEKDNLRFLDIVDDRPFGITMEEQQKIALRHLENFPDRMAFAATFSVDNWGSEQWEEETIAHLKQSIAAGAIAVKIWKNIGMGLKDKNGQFVMIDNPAFDPVLNFLAENKIPVIGHLGEPRNAWLPFDSMTIKGDRNYFTEHPEYHMYRHPEFPSYEKQVAARDHMLEKHPDLHFIAAHLASLEWDLDEVAARLDKFPNMAADLARMPHLRLHAKNNWQKTHDFFIKYQDRLLYATDPQIGDTKDPAAMQQRVHESWLNNWKFFATDEKMHDGNVNGEFRGLKLPRKVIDKIYRKNAETWLPGSVNRAMLKVGAANDFKITGDGSHENWQHATWINIPQCTAGEPFTTKVKLLYSQTGIYCLFHCQDAKLTATMNADFMDLWKEDVVEVFFWPDEHSPAYFEYELSPLNYELPLLISNDNGDLTRWQPFHYDADRKTQHAIKVQGSGKDHNEGMTSWTAEFFIPFKLLRPLNNIAPKPGTRWRTNLYRVDYDKGETAWSWQPVGESFHEYEKYGTLLFEH